MTRKEIKNIYKIIDNYMRENYERIQEDADRSPNSHEMTVHDINVVSRTMIREGEIINLDQCIFTVLTW